MNVSEIIELLGGAAKVNRILGLKDKSAKDVRAAITSNELRPKWIAKLKIEARRRSMKLNEFMEM